MFDIEAALAAMPEDQQENFLLQWNDPEQRIKLLEEFDQVITTFERQRDILNRAKQARG